MMAPFTPFITETMYSNLQKALPPSKEDQRSVHFLAFPSVKEHYFNELASFPYLKNQKIINELFILVRSKEQLNECKRWLNSEEFPEKEDLFH